MVFCFSGAVFYVFRIRYKGFGALPTLFFFLLKCEGFINCSHDVKREYAREAKFKYSDECFRKEKIFQWILGTIVRIQIARVWFRICNRFFDGSFFFFAFGFGNENAWCALKFTVRYYTFDFILYIRELSALQSERPLEEGSKNNWNNSFDLKSCSINF